MNVRILCTVVMCEVVYANNGQTIHNSSRMLSQKRHRSLPFVMHQTRAGQLIPHDRADMKTNNNSSHSTVPRYCSVWIPNLHCEAENLMTSFCQHSETGMRKRKEFLRNIPTIR